MINAIGIRVGRGGIVPKNLISSLTEVPNGAPSGLTLTVLSDNGINIVIQLDWNSTSTNQDGYRIYKSEDGGLNYSLYSIVLGQTKQITDLITTIFYKFKIVAYKSIYESIASNEEEFFVGSILLANTISLIENSVTHPSVIKFSSPWNGYLYWTCATPYPSDNQENPSIWVSNDGKTWVVPPGLTNPIYAHANYPKPSDPCIVYDATLNKLVMYFKNNGAPAGLRRGSSSDGITWSSAALVNINISTPSVIIKPDSVYIIFGGSFGVVGSQTVIQMSTSNDGITWTALVDCNYPEPRSIWHIEVKLIDGIYYMLGADTFKAETGSYELYLYTSNDGITWSVTTTYPIIDKKIFGTKFYKTAFLSKGNNRFDIYAPEWTDWPNEFRITLFKNITLPFPSTRPNINLSYVPTLPYLVGDNFTRNNTTLNLGNATSGQAWTNADAYRHMEIRSNKGIKDDNVAPGMALIDIGITDNYIVEARFSTDLINEMANMAILVRWSTYLYFWRIGVAGNDSVGYALLSLTCVNNGAQSGKLTLGYIKNGDIMGVKVIGNVYYLYINNTMVGSYTDASNLHLDKTKVGIYIQNRSTAKRGFCDLFTVRNI